MEGQQMYDRMRANPDRTEHILQWSFVLQECLSGYGIFPVSVPYDHQVFDRAPALQCNAIRSRPPKGGSILLNELRVSYSGFQH